jgi:hypothetical protein
MTKNTVINFDEMMTQTPLWPTHKHTPEFWEALGRSIAAFGFLEETLAKAIFVVSGSKEISLDQDNENEIQEWNKLLESSLSDTLGRLTKKLNNALKESKKFDVQNLSSVVEQLNRLNEWRNILCHCSWSQPDSEGKSKPFFVNNNKEIANISIDLDLLKLVMKETVEITVYIMNIITSNGFDWPGMKPDSSNV